MYSVQLRTMEALRVCGCAKRHRIALSGLGIATPMAPLIGECGCFLLGTRSCWFFGDEDEEGDNNHNNVLSKF